MRAATRDFHELALMEHRPILRLAFADESRVSRRPTRFDVFLRSSCALSSTRCCEVKNASDASVASPSLLRFGFPNGGFRLGQDHDVLGPS